MPTLTTRSHANVHLLDRLASSRFLDLDVLLEHKLGSSPKIKMLAKYRRDYGFEHLPQPPPAVTKQEDNFAGKNKPKEYTANAAKRHDGVFSFDSGMIKINTQKRLLYSPPRTSLSESKVDDMDEINPYMEFFKRLVLPESPKPKPEVATAQELRNPMRKISRNNRIKAKGFDEIEQNDTEEVADILLGLMSPNSAAGGKTSSNRSSRNTSRGSSKTTTTTPKRRRTRRVESDSIGLSALISPSHQGIRAAMPTFMRSKKKRSPPRPQSADGSGRKRKRSSKTLKIPSRVFTFDRA
mmetsp:Transcript_28069/g.39200  ORF Transcript_28069/g.39200 Transcript_28069/m.39200 type:complete len:296 (-) Transcript_28069:207-1094(-)